MLLTMTWHSMWEIEDVLNLNVLNPIRARPNPLFRCPTHPLSMPHPITKKEEKYGGFNGAVKKNCHFMIDNTSV